MTDNFIQLWWRGRWKLWKSIHRHVRKVREQCTHHISVLLLCRRVLAVASMVRQAQVSVVIDHGKSVKNCKNEEFELPSFFIL